MRTNPNFPSIQSILHTVDHWQHRKMREQSILRFLPDLNERLATMAKKRENPANTTNSRSWGDMTFLDITLSDEEVQEFAVWLPEQEQDIDVYIDDLAIAGYKGSFGYDFENECAMFTITCKNPKSRYNNCAVTSRAESTREALYLSGFKLFWLGERGNLLERKRRKNWG